MEEERRKEAERMNEERKINKTKKISNLNIDAHVDFAASSFSNEI